MRIVAGSFRWLAAAALSLGIVTCGDATGPSAASIEISDDEITVAPNATYQLTAVVRAQDGAELPGARVDWRSTDETVASVTPSGNVAAIRPGSVFVIATSGAAADSVDVTVPFGSGPVATVEVLPRDSVTVEVGRNVQLDAVLRGALGEILLGRVVSWSSADASRVEVTNAGRITAVKTGRVTVTATSEGKTGATLAISVQPPRDFSLREAHITQATQALDGSMPMVAGRPAAVNVVLTASPFTNLEMEVVLRLTDDAGALLRADTLLSAGALDLDAGLHAPKPQFLVPAAFVRAGVHWQVVRDPRGRVGDDSTENDVFPRDGPRPLVAVAVPPLKIRFVPIRLNAHNNVVGIVSAPLLPGYLLALRSMYPVEAIPVTTGAVLATDQSFTAGGTAGGATFWNAMLAELDLARALGATDPDEYWYGVVPAPPGVAFPADMLTGASYTPADPSSTGAGTRSAVGIQGGWPGFQNRVSHTVAHEIGHNFGRRDAPCGATAVDPDPTFPYASGTIGVIAHDVRIWSDGFVAGTVTHAATDVDIMGPCGVTRWISDYTYRSILEARGYTPAALRAATGAHRVPSTRTGAIERVLLVRGQVSASGDVAIEPAFAADARVMLPDGTGPYRLTLRASDGRELFTGDFARTVAGHTSAGHFLFAIPMSRTNETALGSIEVRGPRGVSRVRRARTHAAAGEAPRPVARKLSASTARLACGDVSASGVLIRDADSGALLGVSRGRSIDIALRAQTRVVVTCSTGVSSTSASLIVK